MMAREDPARARAVLADHLAFCKARAEWSARIDREHAMFPGLWHGDRWREKKEEKKEEKTDKPVLPPVRTAAAAPPRRLFVGPPRPVEYVPPPPPRHTYQTTDKYIRLPPPPQYDNPIGPRVPLPPISAALSGRRGPFGRPAPSFRRPPPVLSQQAPLPVAQMVTRDRASDRGMDPQWIVKALVWLFIAGWFLMAFWPF
jgi:hypothetical protein